jgi:hypothetical protein
MDEKTIKAISDALSKGLRVEILKDFFGVVCELDIHY